MTRPLPAYRGYMDTAIDEIEQQSNGRGEEGPPKTVVEIVGIFGGGKEALSQLAERMSGTNDRSSKEYKSTRRSLERYTAEEGKQRRTPRAATLEKLQQAATEKQQQDALAQMAARGVRVQFSGRVMVSPGGRKQDERDRDIDIEMPPELVAPFVEAYAEGHYTDSFTEFTASFMDAWGVGAAAIFTDIESLDITLL